MFFSLYVTAGRSSAINKSSSSSSSLAMNDRQLMPPPSTTATTTGRSTAIRAGFIAKAEKYRRTTMPDPSAIEQARESFSGSSTSSSGGSSSALGSRGSASVAPANYDASPLEPPERDVLPTTSQNKSHNISEIQSMMRRLTDIGNLVAGGNTTTTVPPPVSASAVDNVSAAPSPRGVKIGRSTSPVKAFFNRLTAHSAVASTALTATPPSTGSHVILSAGDSRKSSEFTGTPHRRLLPADPKADDVVDKSSRPGSGSDAVPVPPAAESLQHSTAASSTCSTSYTVLSSSVWSNQQPKSVVSAAVQHIEQQIAVSPSASRRSSTNAGSTVPAGVDITPTSSSSSSTSRQPVAGPRSSASYTMASPRSQISSLPSADDVPPVSGNGVGVNHWSTVGQVRPASADSESDVLGLNPVIKSASYVVVSSSLSDRSVFYSLNLYWLSVDFEICHSVEKC